MGEQADSFNLIELAALMWSAGLVLGQAASARAARVRSVMSQRRDILAGQTLRNWTMGANSLASTAAILIMGLPGIVLTPVRRAPNHAGQSTQ